MSKSVKRSPVVEAKVKMAGLVALVVGWILSLLGRYVFGGEVPEFVTAFVESGVEAVLLGGLTFVGAWWRRHTPRDVVDVDVE